MFKSMAQSRCSFHLRTFFERVVLEATEKSERIRSCLRELGIPQEVYVNEGVGSLLTGPRMSQESSQVLSTPWVVSFFSCDKTKTKQ